MKYRDSFKRSHVAGKRHIKMIIGSIQAVLFSIIFLIVIYSLVGGESKSGELVLWIQNLALWKSA